jgi:hypothetical protein
MVIAVITMRVMKMAGHQVIDVVAMRYGLMTAARPVLVALLMLAATVAGRAAGGIVVANGEAVFLHAVTLDVVQVALVQVIHMAIMFDACVPAFGPVLMLLPCLSGGHFASPSFKTGTV